MAEQPPESEFLTRSEWWDDAGRLSQMASQLIRDAVRERLNNQCPKCARVGSLLTVYKLFRLPAYTQDEEDVPLIAICCDYCGGYLFFCLDYFFRKVGDDQGWMYRPAGQ